MKRKLSINLCTSTMVLLLMHVYYPYSERVVVQMLHKKKPNLFHLKRFRKSSCINCIATMLSAKLTKPRIKSQRSKCLYLINSVRKLNSKYVLSTQNPMVVMDSESYFAARRINLTDTMRLQPHFKKKDLSMQNS